MSDPERPPDQTSDQPPFAGPDDPTRVGMPVPTDPTATTAYPTSPSAPVPADPRATAPGPGQLGSPGSYPPGSFPPGSFSPGSYPPPPTPGPPGNYPPGNYPPGNYPPGNYPPASYPPGSYPPANYPSPGPYAGDAGRGFQPVQTPVADQGKPWLIALVAVLLVAVLGVLAYMLLTGGGADQTPSPGPTARPTAAGQATATPTASVRATAAPTASSTPGAGSPSTSGSPPPLPAPSGLPGDIAAQIDLVVRQVPGIRQLQPERDVPYELITREQFQADLKDLLAEETDPERLATEERFLKRLGLLPAELDLAAALEELYGSQVAAFYRPDTGRFYVIERDAPFGAMDRVIVAHEYTHALQDQHFDLEGSRIKDLNEGDAVIAQLAVSEGDATAVMFEWALANLSFEEILEMSGQSLSPTDQEILDDLPPILRRQLEFPYLDGMAFVDQIRGDGDWRPINEALTEPPESTEQILHPDKYLADEAPIDVQVPDLAAVLGDGWSLAYEQTMGELNIQILAAAGEEPPLSIPGLPLPPPHAEVAAGWGGDRLEMYEHPDGRWAIAWRIAWDSEGDAIEFQERASDLAPTFPGTPTIITSDDTTEYVAASDVSIVNALIAALGGEQ